jgi:uncharacterized protein involved in copper resistance
MERDQDEKNSPSKVAMILIVEQHHDADVSSIEAKSKASNKSINEHANLTGAAHMGQAIDSSNEMECWYIDSGAMQHMSS